MARCTRWKPKWPTRVRRAAVMKTAVLKTWSGRFACISQPGRWMASPIRICTPTVSYSTPPWDNQEQAWKAGQFRELKRDAPYFEAVFHSRLAYRLHDLGLPIERTTKGWELAGVGKELLERFLASHDPDRREGPRERDRRCRKPKSELGARTRERKRKDLDAPPIARDLAGHACRRKKSKCLRTLERKLGGDAEPRDENTAARAIDHAIGHVFKDPKSGRAGERQFLATALKHGAGEVSAEGILKAAKRSDLIFGERGGRRLIANPLAGVERLNADVDIRHKRRAVTGNEFALLLKSASKSGIRPSSD